MKVKMLRNAASSLGCRIPEGQTGDVDDVTGKKLVAFGLAVCLDPPLHPPKAAPVILAVPDAPAISEAKPAAIQPAKPKPLKAPVLTVKHQTDKDQ